MKKQNKTDYLELEGRKLSYLSWPDEQTNCFPVEKDSPNYQKCSYLYHVKKNVLVNIPFKIKPISKLKMFCFKSPMGCTLHLIGDYITCI